MKFNFTKRIFILFSAFGLFVSKSDAANENKILENTESPQTGLADQMIENQIFQLDPDTNTVQIDEERLLQTLRDELNQKIKDKNTRPSDQKIYQDLIKQLQPGSFGRRNNGAPGLNSMDFRGGH